jgi:hypothetical protein
VAVACLVVAGLLLWRGGTVVGVAAPAPPAPAPALSAADHAAAQGAAAALRDLVRDPLALVAAPMRAQVGSRIADAVPPGSVSTPDEASWAPDGLGGGTMIVTLSSPGQQDVDFAAVMVQEDGEWKVLETVPLEGGPVR